MGMIVEIKSRLLLGSRLFIMIGIKGLPEPFAANAEFVKVYFFKHKISPKTTFAILIGFKCEYAGLRLNSA